VAELIWPGKYDRGARIGPPREGPPISTMELHPAQGAAQAGLPRGGGDAPNRLILGDKSPVLAALHRERGSSFDLAYIDPPFDTGSRFDFRASIPDGPADAPRIAVHAYDDARGLDAWLAWFSDTAWMLHDLLVEGGSLYVHLDAHVAHYAKVVLDELFGAGGFQREIIWRIGWISGFKSRARSWIRNHDTLLFYAKGGRPRTFHKELIPYPPGYVRRDGAPPRGAGVPVDDVWNGCELDRLDSIQIVSFSGEKVGYPTQKNEALVSRIVRASSAPGDWVLDCFVGSGTTAIAAEKLGRRWVVSDVAPVAIHSTRGRLMTLPERKPFCVARVGPAPAESPSVVEASACVDGPLVTVEITGFSPGAAAAASIPPDARRAVSHWSQWIEGWCVDWDFDGHALRAQGKAWRDPREPRLCLSLTHGYEQTGRHRVRVKAFDILGGDAAIDLDVDVPSCPQVTERDRARISLGPPARRATGPRRG
jgi:hypothetical protein